MNLPGSNREEELAAAYTRNRSRLIGVAYAVLGTRAEAEDVVSDCWLRLVSADQRERVLDVDAWSTVVVARRALDVLRSARLQRETYTGPWLPEPLLEDQPGINDPAERVTLDERVSFALMVVLETLTPAERTSWVLHDLFGLTFAEIAEVVGRSPAAVRQLAVRARAHVTAAAPRIDVDTALHRRTVAAFFSAAAEGDLAGLLAVLDPTVVLTSDGGGQISAARRPIHGADRVARFLIGVSSRITPGQRAVPSAVNGGPGFMILDGASAILIGSITVDGGRVQRVDLVLAPDKLPRGPVVDVPDWGG
ncbi:MAG TPA: RNA polymerase sigma factor SigJ [Kineosporiaceae bacterium]|nr:RNA polymerase sigma factor SigJ [Kineosporiaceae bacterium]